MKKAEIISVGTELLMGQVANTDAQYISAKLPEAGIGVYYHTVVGDNPGKVREAVDRAFWRSDIIILTGGLGPTQDDLTKKAVAETFGLGMKRDAETAASIEKYFLKIGKKMAPGNLSQADFPERSIILENCCGTAPGCVILFKENVPVVVAPEKADKLVALLPGPPRELQTMFDNELMPMIREMSTLVFKSRYYSIIGVPESEVEKRLIDVIDGKTNPNVATYVGKGYVSVRVSYSGDDADKVKNTLRKYDRLMKSRFGDDLFSTRGENVQECFLRRMKERGLTFSCAESCTGGLVAELVTSVPGASSVLRAGIVSYSNLAKINLLGVESSTIGSFGAVSAETAADMARGAAERCGTEVAVSVTGNAGPGVMEGKAQGLVYIGAWYNGALEVGEFRFGGGRENVRMRAAVTALDMARRLVLKHTPEKKPAK